MAAMTRSRAIGYITNNLMAEYYGQRSGAGLIITEGASPSPEGLGYARIPGIFNEEQIAGWRKTTDRVHAADSKIFVQLTHCGRIASVYNLPPGEQVVGMSAITAAGQIHTDDHGMQDYPVPAELTTEQVYDMIDDHVRGAVNAIKAGFDGAEFHGANGYLLEQSLNPNVNTRSDEFGGSVQNRCSFTLEIIKRTAAAIGPDKIGIKLSPCSKMGDLQPYDEVEETYEYLADELNKIRIAFIDVVLSPDIPQPLLASIRSKFSGTLIHGGGLSVETAIKGLEDQKFDLPTFARNFLPNPDFPERIEKNTALNQPDPKTFYTTGPHGFTDYAAMS